MDRDELLERILSGNLTIEWAVFYKDNTIPTFTWNPTTDYSQFDIELACRVKGWTPKEGFVLRSRLVMVTDWEDAS